MNRVPMPGDAVRYVGDDSYWRTNYDGNDRGFAIIEGEIGTAEPEFRANFAYSRFRGGTNGERTRGYVSCSGGPVPLIKATELEPTDETAEIVFWCWKDLPRGNGGEDYSLSVPVWNWRGPSEGRFA
jgi:hypothetical protein